MKVYACYDNKDYEYRWNTILKFGQSWDVIGTVIMKNPGSELRPKSWTQHKKL